MKKHYLTAIAFTAIIPIILFVGCSKNEKQLTLQKVKIYHLKR